MREKVLGNLYDLAGVERNAVAVIERDFNNYVGRENRELIPIVIFSSGNRIRTLQRAHRCIRANDRKSSLDSMETERNVVVAEDGDSD